jgi:hypothetical protein
MKKRDYRFSSSVIPLEFLEAAIGVEPMNNGFADHCLDLLATPPVRRTLFTIAEKINKENIKQWVPILIRWCGSTRKN